jgi:hypothetical protein
MRVLLFPDGLPMTLLRFVPRTWLAATVLAAGCSASLAQSPSPPIEAPKPACTKPEEFPGNLASDRRKNAWAAEVKAYLACLKKFVDDQNAIAQAHFKAAGAAIEEHNAVAKAANEIAKKSSE